MNSANKINKPISMIIKETKAKITTVINESMLSPVVLDLILQGVFVEVHSLAERQAMEEEKTYVEAIKNNDIEESINDM